MRATWRRAQAGRLLPLKLSAMSSTPPLPTFRRSLMQAAIALLGATALGIAACGGGGGGGGDDAGGIGGPPLETSLSADTRGTVTTLGAQLTSPWALAFLPDGQMLVTEKGGTVALVAADGSSVLARLSGPGSLTSENQGGLLDIALDPDFATTRRVFMTFSETGTGGNGTAVARGQLSTDYTSWTQAPQTIWQQTPKLGSTGHYGARIAFRSDNTMYVATGERNIESTDGIAQADGVQNAANTIGKVVRLTRDGAPADGSTLGIYSGGHRNPQGAAVRPGSDELWITEHGPQGGDELNRVSAGANFGWPLRSYGCPYGSTVGAACRVNGGTHAPNFAEPKAIWVPTSTAPSGLMFYTGSAFPAWQGSVFSGALNGSTLWRIEVDGSGNATSRQEIQAVQNLNVRIRDVRQGPDGNIYLLTNVTGTNASRIVRLAP
jgi:aldose sugar dehydrogenase